MAIPSSGPISLTTVQTEFGGVAPIGLVEYYAGGLYVPAGTTGTYGAVPSSGAISLRNFYGTSNVVIEFTPTAVDDIAVEPDSALAGYQINSNGRDYAVNGTSLVTTEIEQWITPTSAASQYEVYPTVTSGTLTFGFINAWLVLNTSYTWYVEQVSSGVKTASMSFQVRKTGTATVLDTWTVDLTATRSA